MTHNIRNILICVVMPWLLAMPVYLTAQAPTDDELKALEQQIEKKEAEQAETKKKAEAEAKKKAEAERKQKEEEAAQQRAAEEQKKQEEAAAKQAAEEEKKKQEENAARQHVAEAAGKIAVYIGLNVATSTSDYYGVTLEPGRCLMESIEKSLSATFHMVKMVNSDKLSDTERSEVGFLLVVERPEFTAERKGLATSLFELTNSFSLFTPDGNLIENYTEKNSADVTTSSLSIADNIKTAKEAVCTLTNNNLSSLVNKISSNPRIHNP